MPSVELRHVPPIVSRIIASTPLIKSSSILSRYLRTTFPDILGCRCSVLPLSAIGRRRIFRRKAFASSVFLNPPGDCLWSPHQMTFFFLIAGCNGSLGYWQSLATRESNKQHQWYCVPKESQVPIHYDLSHHNLCMTERMVHKREKRHNNTRTTKARKHQPTTKTNTHNQTQNHRQRRGET